MGSRDFRAGRDGRKGGKDQRLWEAEAAWRREGRSLLQASLPLHPPYFPFPPSLSPPSPLPCSKTNRLPMIFLFAGKVVVVLGLFLFLGGLLLFFSWGGGVAISLPNVQSLHFFMELT